MKKYFSYFFLIILSCTALSTTSCSDDDDHPYQSVINDSDSRITFGDINIEPNYQSLLRTYDNTTHVSAESRDESIFVSISYTGDSKAGVKKDPSIVIWEGSNNTTYTPDKISKLEVVKVQEPKGETSGKIWIVAVIDGEEFVFVNEYQIEGGQDQ